MSEQPLGRPIPAPAPLRRRGRVGTLLRLVLLVVLMIGAGGYFFGGRLIDLSYQGDAPAIDVPVEGFAEGAIATEGVAVSPDGQVHVATGTGQILRLNDDGSVSEFVDLSGLQPDAERHAICQIAFAPNGNLYVAHYAHGVLRMIEPDGRVSTIDDTVVEGSKSQSLAAASPAAQPRSRSNDSGAR